MAVFSPIFEAKLRGQITLSNKVERKRAVCGFSSLLLPKTLLYVQCAKGIEVFNWRINLKGVSAVRLR